MNPLDLPIAMLGFLSILFIPALGNILIACTKIIAVPTNWLVKIVVKQFLKEFKTNINLE